jgi:hypothetical protein
VHTPKVLAFTWTRETCHLMAGVETNIRIELSAQGKDTFELMTHFDLPSARSCWSGSVRYSAGRQFDWGCAGAVEYVVTHIRH